MRSAVKKVIFTFSLVGSIAAQAISVGKVDFEKKSITGVEVELASSKSNNVSVCGAHVGGLWSLTRSDITGIQVGGLMTSADNLYGAQIGLMWAGDILVKDIVESNNVFGVQIGGYGCAAVGMSGVQIGGFGPCCLNEMNGVQIGGFGPCCTNEVNGVQIGGLGPLCENEVNGIQIGGLGSGCWNKMNGIQIGGWGSLCTNEVNGIQIGGICCGAGKMRGVQIAGLFSAGDKMSGLQIGAINYFIKDVSGVQIGVFNYAGEKSDNCLQIGVVNWLSANETMKIVPFVNMNF